MKHIIILFIIITLTSCSFFNDTKVDFSIKNSSNNVLKNIVFKTSCDSIIIKELKPNEILKKELLYSTSSNKDKNVTFGFRLNFLKDSLKNDSFFCNDVLNSISNKKVHLIILKDDIKSDIQGIECY